MPTIFLTGATGYIGGHTLQLITAQHPEWSITALIRSATQAKIIQEKFPLVRVVVGCFEDVDIVAKCAAEADVVLNLASSHLPSSTHIIANMPSSPENTTTPTFIHLSSLATLQNHPHGYGRPSSLIYNDNDQRTLANQFCSSSAEHAIRLAGERHGVETVTVCMGLVYGMGRGAVRKRGTTVPELIGAVVGRGRGFVVGEGRNVMSCIHIDDVASALLTLTDHALNTQRASSPATPNPNPPSTFYFLSSPFSISMLSLIHLITTALSTSPSNTIHALPSEIEHLPPNHSTQIHPWAPLLWGSNCVGEASLLHELGWRANGPGLLDVLEEMVGFEVGVLGARGEDVWCAWKRDVKARREEVGVCF